MWDVVVTVLCWSGLLTVVTGCIEVCSYTFVFVTIDRKSVV